MAFLGSVGKFFTTGPGKYIYPPATVNIVLAKQLSQGDVNPIHYAQALKETYVPSPPPRRDLFVFPQPGINPDQRLQAVTQGPFIQTPFTSGGFIDDLFREEPAPARARDVGYFTEAPWPMERSLPWPGITPPGLAYSTPASTPGLVPEILSAGSLLFQAADFFS